jgi:DNA-binding response OmpR family regulator
MYPDGQNILLIDGEPRRRQHCERVLAKEGFPVTAVAEGFSAIRAAARRRFALAVIAVDLPGSLHGVETLRQLRARQPWLRTLFTGEPASRPRRLDPDRDDFIAMAFHSHELLGCVFELLQRESLFAKSRDLAG